MKILVWLVMGVALAQHIGFVTHCHRSLANPLIALAKKLKERTPFQITFYSYEDCRKRAEISDLNFTSLGVFPEHLQLSTIKKECVHCQQEGRLEFYNAFVNELGEIESVMIESLLPLWKDSKPDFLVTSGTSVGAVDVADHYNIPMAIVLSGCSEFSIYEPDWDCYSHTGYRRPVFLEEEPEGPLTRFWHLIQRAYTVYMQSSHVRFKRNEVRGAHGLGPLHCSTGSNCNHVPMILIKSLWGVQHPKYIPPYFQVLGSIIHRYPDEILDPEIRAWLDDSEHSGGFFYCAIGTVMSMNEEQRSAFSIAFSLAPYRVLWVDNGQNDINANVYRISWSTQIEVLRHPNIRVFITHGGVNGINEAMKAGVPLICIPFRYDMYPNCKHLEDEGVAIMIEKDNLTYEAIMQAMHKAFSSEDLKKNMMRLKQVSESFGGADKGANMIEMAVQIGTKYLVPHYNFLPWYKRYDLDILLTFLTLGGIATKLLTMLVKKAFSKGPKLKNE